MKIFHCIEIKTSTGFSSEDVQLAKEINGKTVQLITENSYNVENYGKIEVNKEQFEEINAVHVYTEETQFLLITTFCKENSRSIRPGKEIDKYKLAKTQEKYEKLGYNENLQQFITKLKAKTYKKEEIDRKKINDIVGYFMRGYPVKNKNQFQGGLSDELFNHPIVQNYIGDGGKKEEFYCWGYVGNSNRTVGKDKAFEEYYRNDLKLNTEEIANFLKNKDGRHFCDSYETAKDLGNDISEKRIFELQKIINENTPNPFPHRSKLQELRGYIHYEDPTNTPNEKLQGSFSSTFWNKINSENLLNNKTTNYLFSKDRHQKSDLILEAIFDNILELPATRIQTVLQDPDFVKHINLEQSTPDEYAWGPQIFGYTKFREPLPKIKDPTKQKRKATTRTR
jgi:hypothetical protein